MDFVDSDKKSWKSCPGVLNCICMCQLFQRNVFFLQVYIRNEKCSRQDSKGFVQDNFNEYRCVNKCVCVTESWADVQDLY